MGTFLTTGVSAEKTGVEFLPSVTWPLGACAEQQQCDGGSAQHSAAREPEGKKGWENLARTSRFHTWTG